MIWPMPTVPRSRKLAATVSVKSVGVGSDSEVQSCVPPGRYAAGLPNILPEATLAAPYCALSS